MRSGKFVNPSSSSVTAAINRSIKELEANIKTPIVNASGKNSYPISGLTYVILYKSGTKASTVKLWQWALEGAQQEMAKELLYAPLPGSLVKLNLRTLSSVH